MTGPIRAMAAAILVMAGAGLAVATLDARDRWFPQASDDAPVRRFANGRAAERLALSFDAVMADIYWIRTVQYFAGERASNRFSGRFDALEPLLDVTTTLDPYFSVAYQFGAIFLSEPQPDGAGRSDLALALLEKGLRVEQRWQYAETAGFVHYFHTKDLVAAAGQFERAARMPGAPAWLGPLAANTLARGGSREGAMLLFKELAASPERWVRELAERRLRELAQEGGR